MGERHACPHGLAERKSLLERDAIHGDVGRTAVAEEAFERLLEPLDHPRLHQRTRNVRSARCSPYRLGQDRLGVQLDAELREPLADHDDPGTPVAVDGPQSIPQDIEPRAFLDAVDQQVNIAVRGTTRELEATQDSALLTDLVEGLVVARHRVVVGETEELDPSFARPTRHLACPNRAVGVRRVTVKLDLHGTKLPHFLAASSQPPKMPDSCTYNPLKHQIRLAPQGRSC